MNLKTWHTLPDAKFVSGVLMIEFDWSGNLQVGIWSVQFVLLLNVEIPWMACFAPDTQGQLAPQHGTLPHSHAIADLLEPELAVLNKVRMVRHERMVSQKGPLQIGWVFLHHFC